MSPAESLFLALVVAAFGCFAAALAYGSWVTRERK